MWTSWASEYILKQDKLGTLVPGKFADLVILDRDYFTVPVDDLLKIRTPMTMVGGKIIQLQPSLASDLGIEPVGPSYDFSDEDVAAEFLKEARGN
jgi:cytosine/adenosine deaminase-related metal-dependent hydrolase